MLGDVQRPDAQGRFGTYGGKYVPETLMPALEELDKAYQEVVADADFQVWVTAGSCRLLHSRVYRRVGTGLGSWLRPESLDILCTFLLCTTLSSNDFVKPLCVIF